MLYSCCSVLTVVLLAEASEPGLPEIERDYTVVSPTKKTGQPLAILIPPASIARIILVKRLTTSKGAPRANSEVNPDELFVQAFKSPAKARDWGLLATERTASEFVLVTKKGELYRVEILNDLRSKGEATALLVYGKGFSCRYDLDLSKKGSPTGK